MWNKNPSAVMVSRHRCGPSRRTAACITVRTLVRLPPPAPRRARKSWVPTTARRASAMAAGSKGPRGQAAYRRVMGSGTPPTHHRYT